MDEVVILMAEDDAGHAELVKRNLKKSGISNEILRFADGAQVINFLFRKGNGPHRDENKAYLLLLDIRMPGLDGIEVLRTVKSSEELKSMPVIMLTTTNTPEEVERCHKLGCNSYITKPVDYTSFVDALHSLGLFLRVVTIPGLKGGK
ncbi:MAG: response regulator [Sedimentisphaerales bacterium]|nr:response regulator [Sedimentisphaerales bacterium]